MDLKSGTKLPKPCSQPETIIDFLGDCLERRLFDSELVSFVLPLNLSCYHCAFRENDLNKNSQIFGNTCNE